MTTEKNKIVNNNNQTNDLIIFRDQIQQIKRSSMSEIEESLPKKIKLERTYETVQIADPLIEEQMIDESSTSDIKRYIREQIKISERKILHKMDRIERKLNQLLELKGSTVDSDSDEKPDVSGEQPYEEEHIIEEYVNDESEENHGQIDEYSSLIFPIADEGTFDWFMLKLKDDEYRNNLVNKRWALTRNVGTRSFNVSVKDFLRMHFDLSVCIKYSVSGFGSRGSKKKKVDSKTLSFYLFDCFNRSNPNMYSLEDVSKAITCFWGRSQDTYTKLHDRALKRELLNNSIE